KVLEHRIRAGGGVDREPDQVGMERTDVERRRCCRVQPEAVPGGGKKERDCEVSAGSSRVADVLVVNESVDVMTVQIERLIALSEASEALCRRRLEMIFDPRDARVPVTGPAKIAEPGAVVFLRD